MDSSTLEPSHDPAQRVFELTALYEVSRILLETPPERRLSFEVLTAAMGLAGSLWGVIWVLAADGCVLEPAGACGRPLPEREPVALPPEWHRFLATRADPLMWKEFHRSSDGKSLSAGTLPAVSLPWLDTLDPEMVVPLSAQGRLHGLIALGPNSLNQPYEPFLLGILGSIGHLVAVALSRRSLERESAPPEAAGTAEDYRRSHPALRLIVGESDAVMELYRDLVGVAQASCTVLLEGETGTGKQLAAEVLHRLGPRSTGPFIEVDCSAFPETLIDSELFGHKRGAFTGASADRRGVFEMAHGGTLFLDELGNLPPNTQSRLLRVLQERRFRPLGSERTVDVDVRVVAATNRDLREDVRAGAFREDLYYRVYVYPIRLAPLRERKEDIPVLARHFIEVVAAENRLPAPVLAQPFLDRLQEYPFPGNVRELSHLMERVLLRAKGKSRLDPDDLNEIGMVATAPVVPPPARAPSPAGMERGAWVLERLRSHRFNIKATAEALARRAGTHREEAPPLTDRSSLTYYLQGECFRLYLENGGDVTRAGSALAGSARELTAIATSRLRSNLNGVLRAIGECATVEEARSRLHDRLSKLPADYRGIVDRLAEHVWGLKETGVSSL